MGTNQTIKQPNNQTILHPPHNCSKRILDENQKLAVIEVPRRREPDKKTDWQAAAALKKQAEIAAFFPELSKLSELSKPPEPPKPVYYRPPKTASLPQKCDSAKTLYWRKRAYFGISRTLTLQDTPFLVGFSRFRRIRGLRGFSAKKGPERTRESHRRTHWVSVSDGHSLGERKHRASPRRCRSLTEQVSVAHRAGVGRSPSRCRSLTETHESVRRGA